MAPTAPIAPKIEVGGAPIAERWLGTLTSVRVDRALNLVGRATLRFVDSGYALSSSGVFELGTQVSIKDSGGDDLLDGVVTAAALEQSANRVPELVVTLSDKAAKLAGASRSRTFLNQTRSTVARALVSGSGLTLSWTAADPTEEYLLQAGSDLAYLDALTSRHGLVWSVDGPQLKVVAAGTSSGSVALELGKGLESFSVRASGVGADTVTVTGWSEEQQAKVVGEAKTATAAESTFVAKAAGRRKADGSGAVLVAGSARDETEAKSMAVARLAESAAAAVLAKGSCLANAAVKPGVQVSVANAGPTSGKYLVSAVEHVYGPAGFHTHFTAGPHRPSGMVDLLSSARTDPGFTMSGVLPAVVTDLADPAKTGRAMVEYTTVSGQVASAWARIVTLGAGDKRGMVFQPEVKDEVLIAFEQSDVRRPVILGGLFSKKKGLPTSDNVADNAVKFRRITSRLGHVIELADGTAPDEQHVLITLAGKKHRIRLGEDRLDVVTDGKPIKLTDGTALLEMDGTGKIKLQGTEISIKATSGNVAIEAAQKLTAKGTSGATVQGAQVDLKGDGMMKVEAGGPLTIKGATVAIN